MNKCKCGKEWGEKEKIEMPGTAEKPVQGFSFQFEGDATAITCWWGKDGEPIHPIHPFDRPELKIVSCPECQRTLADLAENEPGAKGVEYVEGKVVRVSSVRRSPLPFVEDKETC